MKTTMDQRDQEKSWHVMQCPEGCLTLNLLDDLETLEQRIATALETVRLGGDPNKALIAVRAILEGK